MKTTTISPAQDALARSRKDLLAMWKNADKFEGYYTRENARRHILAVTCAVGKATENDLDLASRADLWLKLAAALAFFTTNHCTWGKDAKLQKTLMFATAHMIERHKNH